MADAPPGAVSGTRLYLGNLPQNVTKADLENHFSSQNGPGDIEEVKLMNGFGFIEYKSPDAARDTVNMFNGSDLMGSRIVVQFARGSRQRDERAPFYPDRPAPRTRRTVYRMTLSGLPPETSWQDLKDFTRDGGLDVVYSEVSRDRDGKGFVEYETEDDLKNAVDKIDGRDFRGVPVACAAAIQDERPRDRFRSRSPPNRRGGYGHGGGHDSYDRRGPPRGYSPRGYRDRSPSRRDYYESRDRYAGRSPPPPPRARGPPVDDYPPPRRAPYGDDGYGSRGGGGGGGGGGYGGRAPYDREPEPYANGGGHRGGGYDRPPSPGPRRPRSPPRGGYEGGYERRGGYW